MSPSPYRICKRCVMDTTDPKIVFDADGYCNHCTEYLGRRAQHVYHGAESDAAFDRLIDEMAASGKGSRYDCVIGVSGGVDSSYLACLLRDRGLRPLAVHMDNGWNSEEAVSNIWQITNRLGIDYESFVLDWEEFRDLQLAFLKASVPEAETPTDVAIPGALHRVAAKYGVKYITSGGNLATEGILPRAWHYDAKDFKYFRHIHKTFGRRRLTSFPTFGYKREMYYKLIRRIKTVYPLNHVPYSKENATARLQSELGWKQYGEKHHESRYTKFIQSYYLFEKFGIDYRRATLAVAICCGEATREGALEMLESLPYDHDEVEREKLYISKKLGISNSEFERILDLGPKWSWEYPNDAAKLAFIYDAYRMVFHREKLGSF